MTKILDEPGKLSDKEWGQIESALKNTAYLDVVIKLRILKNKSTMAKKLFPEAKVNDGHTHVNNRLYTEGIPFRLTRIGPWSKKIDRKERPLAFVPWGEKEKKLYTKK